MTIEEITIYTIGHSTRLLEDFIWILKKYGITTVADVRTVPRSAFNPQFNIDSLPASLKAAGIGYEHIRGLGGLRHPKKDSPNTGWQNYSFRGFADYMLTADFHENLEKLIALGREGKVAVMCAEAVPFRCHRSLIADALVVRGIKVMHIMSEKKAQEHKLNPMATVETGNIIYAGQTAEKTK
ncbi:MAG: DUF488 domain-containing protein [Actinomycetota bacterium]|nr:DUF488 domain-containing protein [Actinomycetota bacterium]